MAEEHRASPLFVAHQAQRGGTAPDRPLSRSTLSFLKEFKVIVIGSSGVGKTSLVRREAYGEFDGEQKLTLGTERLLSKIEIHDEVIHLALYDTVGQERFMTIPATLYRNAQAVLICFDCSSRSSFEAVGRWYADVERNAPQDALILLIANKTDVPSRAVSHEEGKQKAAELGIHYVETSAKTGQNVKALFALIATALAGEKRLRAASSMIPPPLSAPPSPLLDSSRQGTPRISSFPTSYSGVRRSINDSGESIQLPPPAQNRRNSSGVISNPSESFRAAREEPSGPCWSGLNLDGWFTSRADSSDLSSLEVPNTPLSVQRGFTHVPPSPTAGPMMMPIPTPDEGISLAEVLVEHASLRARTLAGGLRRRNTLDQHHVAVDSSLRSSTEPVVVASPRPFLSEKKAMVVGEEIAEEEENSTSGGEGQSSSEGGGFRMCALGCGAVLEGFRTDHETSECWLRLVPCSLGCGSSFPMLDCVAHERESCKLRTVRCQCGAKFKAEQLVDHSTSYRAKSISLWTPQDVIHFLISVFAREAQRRKINFSRILQDKITGPMLLGEFKMNSVAAAASGETRLAVSLLPDPEMRKTLEDALRNFSFVASSSSSLSTSKPSFFPSSVVAMTSTTAMKTKGQVPMEYGVLFNDSSDEPLLDQDTDQMTATEAMNGKRNPSLIEQDDRARKMLSLGVISHQRRMHMMAPHHFGSSRPQPPGKRIASKKTSDGDEAAGARRPRDVNQRRVRIEDLDDDDGDNLTVTVGDEEGGVTGIDFSATWTQWLRESQESRLTLVEGGDEGDRGQSGEEDSTREVLVSLSLGSRTVAVRTIRFSDLQLVSQDLVGSGSFGSVYFGRYRGAQVAVKHLHYQDISERDLLREAAVMTSVSGHPHVLRFLGVCLERPNICFVSEALECSLEDWLRYDRMNHAEPLREILRFAEEAASGIYHLHLEMVVHCDIAARNLLFDSGNPRRVKVCDFGLARVLPRRNNSQTQFAVPPPVGGGGGSLNLAGPLRWMSPESLRPGGDGLTRFSFASDVYSFAVTIWELLSRDVPYSFLQPHEAAIAVMMENLRPPRAKLPLPVVEQLNQLLGQAVSRKCVLRLVALLEKAWEKDPVQRPTMREMVNELSLLRSACCEEEESGGVSQ